MIWELWDTGRKSPWLGPRSDELLCCHNVAHGATAACNRRPVLRCEMSTLFVVSIGFYFLLPIFWMFLYAVFNYIEKISRRHLQIIAEWLIEICHWICWEYVRNMCRSFRQVRENNFPSIPHNLRNHVSFTVGGRSTCCPYVSWGWTTIWSHEQINIYEPTTLHMWFDILYV